jgi:hypothetical protein
MDSIAIELAIENKFGCHKTNDQIFNFLSLNWVIENFQLPTFGHHSWSLVFDHHN